MKGATGLGHERMSEGRKRHNWCSEATRELRVKTLQNNKRNLKKFKI